MRVIAGELKGRRLHAPAGPSTRPTSDRVREALFSILAGVTDARVLDLYAGSGALGIEALSRGAGSAEFVDRRRSAVGCIRRNLTELGLEAAVHRRDALAWLGEGGVGDRYDLVFCDPPYDCSVRLALPLSERLPALLTQHARIVTESDKRSPLQLDLPLVCERTYGDTRIAIHRGRS